MGTRGSAWGSAWHRGCRGSGAHGRRASSGCPGASRARARGEPWVWGPGGLALLSGEQPQAWRVTLTGRKSLSLPPQAGPRTHSQMGQDVF